MAARLDSVCKYICEQAEWSLSHLRLQKLLYLAQMVHMGRHHGLPLVDARFEAWDYGPVEPSLYRRAKVFGADPVRDIFHQALRFEESDSRRVLLDEIGAKFLPFSAGELVDITHWDHGAWAKHYVPRARHVIIPDRDILDEYHARQRHLAAA